MPPSTWREKWQPWREQAGAILSSANMEPYGDKLLHCGSEIMKMQICPVDPGHYNKPIPKTCSLRICPTCDRRSQLQYAEKLLPVAIKAQTHRPDGYGFKHLVFTTPWDIYDPDAANHLQLGWEIIRKTLDKYLYKHVFCANLTSKDKHYGKVVLKAWNIGYIGGAEYGPKGLMLHYHLLFFGPYLDQGQLSRYYSELTGGRNRIVHVQAVTPTRESLEDSIAYVTKFSTLQPQHLPQALQALDNRARRIKTAGVFYGNGSKLTKPCHCPICNAQLASITPRVMKHHFSDYYRAKNMSRFT